MTPLEKRQGTPNLERELSEEELLRIFELVGSLTKTLDRAKDFQEVFARDPLGKQYPSLSSLISSQYSGEIAVGLQREREGRPAPLECTFWDVRLNLTGTTQEWTIIQQEGMLNPGKTIIELSCGRRSSTESLASVTWTYLGPAV